MREPLAYQPPVLEYLRTHPLAACFMDKRLGKTYCASQWVRYHNAKKTLVVAPISAIPGWLDDTEEDGGLAWDLTNSQNFWEWERFSGDVPGEYFIVNPQMLFKSKGGKIPCPDCEGKGGACAVCKGAGKVARGAPSPTSVALWDWDAVIWDEITALKNVKSQVNQVAHACLGRIPLRCGLSGEYAPEGALDIFEAMRWIFGAFMGRANYYKWRNDNFEEMGYDWWPKKGKLLEIKHTVMERSIVLSRQEAGVGGTVSYDRRYCALPSKIQKVYDHAERLFEVPGQDGAVRYTKYVPVVRNWLCQIAGGYPREFPELHSDHKLKLLWEIVGEERKHEQLVVSFRHIAEMEAANLLLQKRGVKTEMVWGGINAEKRRERSQKFRKGDCRVILKGSNVHFGMDLSAADTMVRHSLPDAYENISQDKDRIVHPTKKRPLLYIDLITRGTVDEDLASAAADKTGTARFFMTNLAKNFAARVARKFT